MTETSETHGGRCLCEVGAMNCPRRRLVQLV